MTNDYWGNQIQYIAVVLTALTLTACADGYRNSADSENRSDENGDHARTAGGQEYDLLIVNGTVVDGSGSPGVDLDVGIRGNRIVFVGKSANEGSARQVIDANGLVVAPGFIDAHNHSLDPAASEEWNRAIPNQNFLTQGVTTLVTGPDGGWSPSQLRVVKTTLAKHGSGINFACYVGHNGIRKQVMGADQQRAPSQAELAQMLVLTREGMQEGCVGLSTGLMYDPGMFSETEEIIAMSNIVAEYGGSYDSHVRDPVWKLVESHSEAIEIGRAAGITAKLGHAKAVGLQNKGHTDRIISLVEWARSEGQDVVSDQYPYDGTATFLLYELVIFPGVEKLYHTMPREQLAQMIDEMLIDNARRIELKRYAENGIDGGFSWIKAVGYGSMRIVVSRDDPALVGENLKLLAEKRNIDPFDLVAELTLEHRDGVLLAGAIEESEVRTLLVQPWNMVASDGFYIEPDSKYTSGHPRSTGTFPRVLGHYARDLGLLSLEEAVRKMTSLPAEHLGLTGRGRIEIGAIADLAVFDPKTVIDKSTWTDPNALSEGIVHVLVNGKFAIRNSELCDAMHGVFVSHLAH